MHHVCKSSKMLIMNKGHKRAKSGTLDIKVLSSRVYRKRPRFKVRPRVETPIFTLPSLQQHAAVAAPSGGL